MASKPLDDLIIGGPDILAVPDGSAGVSLAEGDYGAADENSIVLELADLLPDELGEVVLFTGEDLAVNLLADQAVSAAGTADSHVTASGLDVTGLHFYAFENGVTVYSESDLLISTSADIS